MIEVAVSFTAAVRKKFGLRKGDGLKQFADELKALSSDDREELRLLMIAEGENILPISAEYVPHNVVTSVGY